MTEFLSEAEAQRGAAAASVAFTVALYREVARESENLFFAPASITAALVLAWLG